MTAERPLTAANFVVRLVETASPVSAVLSSILPAPDTGFSECSGLEATMAVDEYAEGGRNTGVLKFPGRVRHPNIKLRRGVTSSLDLWRWHEDFLRGRGRRRDGLIQLLNDGGDVVRSWRFQRGIPIRWGGPPMNALGSQIAIEELEIAHEGLIVRSLGVAGEIAATISSVAESFGRL
jgi:phage tail-like protein